MLFRNFQAPLEDRIEDLLGRLTMEEKAGLMKHENSHGFLKLDFWASGTVHEANPSELRLSLGSDRA